MSQRRLSEGTIRKHEQQKAETIAKVTAAIQRAEALGYVITTKLLQEFTGLSRGVFYAAHVRPLVEGHRDAVVRKKLAITAETLIEENKRLNEQIARIQRDHAEETARLRAEIDNLNRLREILLDRLIRAHREEDGRGISLDHENGRPFSVHKGGRQSRKKR